MKYKIGDIIYNGKGKYKGVIIDIKSGDKNTVYTIEGDDGLTSTLLEHNIIKQKGR